MMSLTPQQKAIGKENFYAAVGSDLTRREFLMAGVTAGVVSGGGLGAFYFGYGKSVNKPIRTAVLGTGDEGSVLIGAINPDFIQVTAIADIRPYSVHRAFHGDWYSDTVLKVRPGLMAKYKWETEDEARKHVKVYRDYRDLLKEEKDIEAVIIALPLHLHAPAAIAAMKAGKHVITEKLMGHTVHECKEMGRVAKQTNTILGVGHQRHYNVLYDNAVDTIRRGLIGDLHHIRAQWHRGNLPGADSWSMPLPPGAKKDDQTYKRLIKEVREWRKELEGAKTAQELKTWEHRIRQKEAQITDALLSGSKDDKWIREALLDEATIQGLAKQYKSASDYGYKDRVIPNAKGEPAYECPAIEELIRWRLWDRTGAGLMAELGSHQLDAASIFIAAAHGGKKQHPLAVAAMGNRPIFGPDRDCEDHVYCLFEFPAPGYDPKDPIAKHKKIGVMYSSINGNGYGGYGEVVFGTRGTLILEREQETMLYKDADIESKVGVSKGKGGPSLDTQASGVQSAAAVGAMALQNISRGYTEELEHFAWCVRNRAPENMPRCKPEVAMADAIIALTANNAARQGARIEFKEEWFDIDKDDTPEGVKPDVGRYA